MSGYLAVLTALVATVVPAAGPSEGTPADRHGCDKSYTYKQAKRGLREALKHHYPMSQAMGANAWKYVRCAREPAHARGLLRLRRHLRAWRSSYAHVWKIRLNGLPATWVQWARNITFRESRWNRRACDYVSCTHFSYFQWALSTWYDAGGTGHPYNASWPHQAVLAIRYARSGHISAWALTNR